MSLVVKEPVYAWSERGLAYIPIPKAACSAVKWALREARDLKLPEPWWKIHEIVWPERKSLQWLYRGCGIYTFTVVRNPWDRLWSCYKSKMHKDRIHDLQGDHPEVKLGMSFVDFCKFVAATPDDKACEHFRSQSAQLTGPYNTFLPNLVIKLEALSQGWPKLAHEFGLPSLRKLNESGGPNAAYPKELVKLLGERYEEDCERFMYFGPSAGRL